MADGLRKFYAKFSYIFLEKYVGVEYIRNQRLYKLLFIWGRLLLANFTIYCSSTLELFGSEYSAAPEACLMLATINC